MNSTCSSPVLAITERRVGLALHRILRTKIHDLQVQLMKEDPSEATQSKVFNGSIPKLMSGRRVTGCACGLGSLLV